MNANPPLRISVVVASNERPKSLARCLTGLRQLDYPEFEILVVADGASLSQLADHPALGFCRTIQFDKQNLSSARNAGIAGAGGDAIAFVDDDSVPEPMWLAWHAAALAESRAAASVGFVRGRNGISFQSRAASVDHEAETHEVALIGAHAQIPKLGRRALKLIGTNCVVFRDALIDVNGFDPAFRYFLEDADLSMRMMASEYRSVVAPLAEVHHSFAASARRTSLRMPRRLFEIGRSTALFLRRHPGGDLEELRARLRARERGRLLRHLVIGTCEPRDVGALLRDLDAGWDEGMALELPELTPLTNTGAFRKVPPLSPGHTVLKARLLGRSGAKSNASGQVSKGKRASVFSFSLTPVRHHLMFTNDGYWLQTGGQFGRSERVSSVFRWCRFANRCEEEIRRVAKQRGIEETTREPKRAGQIDTASETTIQRSVSLSRLPGISRKGHR